MTKHEFKTHRNLRVIPVAINSKEDAIACASAEFDNYWDGRTDVDTAISNAIDLLKSVADNKYYKIGTTTKYYTHIFNKPDHGRVVGKLDGDIKVTVFKKANNGNRCRYCIDENADLWIDSENMSFEEEGNDD